MTSIIGQHPIGSGFTALSTAEDVVAAIDLSGRNVVVTDGHSGTGREITRALAGAGASVTTGSPDRAAVASAGTAGVDIDVLDLGDPASVDAFADRYRNSGRPLHVLVNNVALPAPARLVRDTRGYEAQFATNHLGHFQLTLELLPALRAAHGARVVSGSSAAQRHSDIRWDDLHFATGYDPCLAHAQTSTAAVLFAVELDRRWAEDGIRGYAVDLAPGPGTPQQGAATAVFAASSPLLAGIGGVYLKDNDIAPLDADRCVPGADRGRWSDVAPHAIDPVSARCLWTVSEYLLDPVHLPWSEGRSAG